MRHHHEGCCHGEGEHHQGCCHGEGHHHEGCQPEKPQHGGCHAEEHEHHRGGGCRGEGQHRGGCEHRHGRGGGRRQRFFGHGELRMVILDIVSREASHGYELIKSIENLTQGNYSPSPGVIYPTLDFLQEQSLISISEEDGGRKKIAITAAGTEWLEENREHLDHIQARIQARNVGAELRKNPQMKRALDNFKAVLDLKVNQGNLSDARIKQITGVIDRAALEITQLD